MHEDEAAELERVEQRLDRDARDLAPFTTGPHDIRIVRGDWIYYVRPVRSKRLLLRDRRFGTGGEVIPDGVDSLVAMVLLLVIVVPVVALARWIGRARRRGKPRRPRIVGVVRLPNPATWNNARPAVVVQERIDGTTDLTTRLSSLAAEVESGAWDELADGVDQRRGAASRRSARPISPDRKAPAGEQPPDAPRYLR